MRGAAPWPQGHGKRCSKMTNARSILSFLKTDTHANRPATPTLGAGEMMLYYETDTSHLFAYIQGTGWVQIDSSAGAGASIVQNKSVAVASHATGITLTSGPVQGNLLVAFISDQTGQPTVNTGWEMLQQAAAINDGYGVAIKIAGASESTTQTPASDAHAGTYTVYELSNAAGGLVSAVTQFSGSTVAETANHTKSTGNGLVIGCFVNRTTSGPTSITGTGVIADNTASGQGRFAAAFHVGSPSNGANTITANYATSQGGVFMALSIG